MIARVRRGTAAFVVVGMLAGGLSGCGLPRFGSRGIPDVAATVEGVDIPSTEVEALFQAFRKSAASQAASGGAAGGEDSGQVTDEVVRRTALSYQIRLVFLQSLARKYEVDITPDDSKDEIYEEFVKVQSLASEGMRPEDLKQAAEAEKISKAIALKLAPNVDVNDSELQAAYKLREEALGESFRAQTDIAFLQEEAAATALRDAVRDGKDFKETAEGLKTESDEDALLRSDSVEITPLSPIQGDLIETVRGLKKGDTSEPIRFATDDGPIWVVLHVSEREDLEALKLDDPQVRDELTKLVQDNKRYQFFDQWFNKQFREADINVDGYYGKWKKNSLAVS